MSRPPPRTMDATCEVWNAGRSVSTIAGISYANPRTARTARCPGPSGLPRSPRLRVMSVDVRRKLPSVDALLRSDPGKRAVAHFGRPIVKRMVAQTLVEAGRRPSEASSRRPTTTCSRTRSAWRRRSRPGSRGDQRDRRGAAHEPRQGAAAGGSGARRRPSRPDLLGPGGRSRDGEARQALDPRRGASDRADRSRGRARREQLRRRAPALPCGAGAPQGGPRLTRRADRDRRGVPDPGHHGRVGREARRGRHHEPHAHDRLPRARSPTGPARSSRCIPATTAWSGSRPRRRPRIWRCSPPSAVSRSSSTWAPGCCITSRACRRTSRRSPTRSPTAPTW